MFDIYSNKRRPRFKSRPRISAAFKAQKIYKHHGAFSSKYVKRDWRNKTSHATSLLPYMFVTETLLTKREELC